MKNIANIITIARFILSFCLIFTSPMTVPFVIIYLLCGISDAADGFIARATKTESKLGSVLDSIADLAFFSVVIILYFPVLAFTTEINVWICVIASVRVLSLFIALVKFRVFAPLHTYANKATGLLLFLFPFLNEAVGFSLAAVIICAVALLSAVEELTIQIISKKANRDIKTVFLLQDK